MPDEQVPNQVRKKIAIIDDEIGYVKYGQLTPEIHAVLADSTSPELAELWQYGEELIELPPFGQVDVGLIQKTVEDERFINEVLLSDRVTETGSAEVQNCLRAFKDLHRQSTGVLSAIRAAFPDEEYEVHEFQARPERPADLVQFALVIMDVMMEDGLDFDGVGRYLGRLSEAANDATIPLIMLISHQEERLREKRTQLRMLAQISAAGFCIVSKTEIGQPNFGTQGVQLLWRQMKSQRQEAENTRQLFRTLENAHLNAWEKTKETLWNLDAASLQQIHLSATIDNDPFDEHMLELLSRHYLFNVEADPSVQCALNILGSTFDKYRDDKTVKHRCVNYSDTDLGSMRDLVCHYRWTALRAQKELPAFKPQNFCELNRYLPFGAVLHGRGPLKDGSHVLIHVTQQCDLNRVDLNLKGTSLVFVGAKLTVPKSDADDSFVIPGLALEDHSWDLQVLKNGLFAVPSGHLPRYSKKYGWSVVGRLRSDIARQVQQEVVNHATRLAKLSVTEGESCVAKLCLRIGKPDRTMHNIWYGDDGSSANATSIKLNSFKAPHLLGEESLHIPLWVAGVLRDEGIDGINVDLHDLSNALRSGLPSKGKDIKVGEFTVRVISLNISTLAQEADPFTEKADKVGAGKARLIIAICSGD